MSMACRSEMETRSSRKNRMKPVLFLSWLLLIPMTVSAQTDHTHSPSSAEDFAKLAPALQAVIGAMDEEGLKIEAMPKPESIPAVEPGIQKLEVVLRPMLEVELVGKEKQSEKVENLFGGFIRLTVPKDGEYRISADAPIWINVMDGNQPIERVRTVPRLRCGRIHKSLGFPLQRERSYWVEMSGSKRADVGLLITEEPEHH